MKKAFTFWLATACFCLVGCKEEKKASTSKDTPSSNPLTAPADYVNALGKAQKQAQKTISTVGIDQALKAFYTDEGRFPTNLAELVSKGAISQVPPPPRGMKYD